MPVSPVVNASPLIFLSRSGHLELLRHSADRVLVPQQVADEILQRGDADITAKAVRTTAWLDVVPVHDIPISVASWGLGAGESSVISAALDGPRATVVIDDLAGRKCAISLGLHVRGTLGLVLAAKKDGLVPNARAIIDDLVSGGMYLSRTVIDQALALVDE